MQISYLGGDPDLDSKPHCPSGCCPTPLLTMPMPESRPQPSPRPPRSEFSICRRNFAAATASSIFPNSQFTNHESLPPLSQSFHEFLEVYPQYSDTHTVDRIRETEYSHISRGGLACLDYIGVGLFSHSQLPDLGPNESQSQTASSSMFSPSPSRVLNPEFPFFSLSYKTGSLKTQLLLGGGAAGGLANLETLMRKRIMEFLHISEDDYAMVFTANRMSAFKLLAESYPFQTSRKLLTVYDYESEAVDAMINSSEKRGAKVMSAEFSWPRLGIHSAKLRSMIVTKKVKKKREMRGLFVFPVHSRVSGTRYPYIWMKIAQENGWHVLLDACALGPKDMDSFGLSLIRPDFIVCSFYKIFGENPSGFGCLFVKKSAVPILETSLCMGTVSLVPVGGLLLPLDEMADPSNSFSEQEECASGELDCTGLDHVDILPMTVITNRGRYLINWLVKAMLKLEHPNTEGVRLVRIYGPKVRFDRGPALAFNVFDWKGEKVEPVLVQKLADRSGISISYGFLHHICFSEKYREQKAGVIERRTSAMVAKKGKERVEGVKVVTLALGFLTAFEDVYRLWAFVSRFLDADFVEKERWRYTALDQKTVDL
ncbi:hypothetical protein MLD38_033564 [Melastoma candidum]|uniref:Uncharacterized protein n=2 Tax=Melastoma candidum TaxID=119954 RepID=A0ACB9M9A3_9MYRT|nr:hypothetical protein MLD38_033564 [Melastoma candidum]